MFFLATQYASPLLVLGFTVERYVSVCHPFERQRYCTTRRSRAVIGSLVATSLSLHLVQSYFWHYDPLTQECIVRPEVTANDVTSVWSVWSWVTELLVFGLVPVAILVLNVLVVAEARRMSADERRFSVCTGPSADKSASGSSSTTTAMLLAVSFYLIATTLPVTVAYAIFFTFPMGDQQLLAAEPEVLERDVTWRRHFAYWTVRTVIQEVSMSHFAGNFYIYLATGRIFRKQLWRMMTSCMTHPFRERHAMRRIERLSSTTSVRHITNDVITVCGDEGQKTTGCANDVIAVYTGQGQQPSCLSKHIITDNV